MTTGGSQRRPPRGLARWFLRVPIVLYRVGLGWLLGERFLLLEHVGRRTGLKRQAVVEVVRHDPASDSYVIASGFGERADWLRNVQQTPDVTVRVGRQRLAMRAERLPAEEAGEELARYARRHATSARALAAYMGLDVDGSEASYRAAGAAVPFVMLRPREDAQAAS